MAPSSHALAVPPPDLPSPESPPAACSGPPVLGLGYHRSPPAACSTPPGPRPGYRGSHCGEDRCCGRSEPLPVVPGPAPARLQLMWAEHRGRHLGPSAESRQGGQLRWRGGSCDAGTGTSAAWGDATAASPGSPDSPDSSAMPKTPEFYPDSPPLAFPPHAQRSLAQAAAASLSIAERPSRQEAPRLRSASLAQAEAALLLNWQSHAYNLPPPLEDEFPGRGLDLKALEAPPQVEEELAVRRLQVPPLEDEFIAMRPQVPPLEEEFISRRLKAHPLEDEFPLPPLRRCPRAASPRHGRQGGCEEDRDRDGDRNGGSATPVYSDWRYSCRRGHCRSSGSMEAPHNSGSGGAAPEPARLLPWVKDSPSAAGPHHILAWGSQRHGSGDVHHVACEPWGPCESRCPPPAGGGSQLGAAVMDLWAVLAEGHGGHGEGGAQGGVRPGARGQVVQRPQSAPRQRAGEVRARLHSAGDSVRLFPSHTVRPQCNAKAGAGNHLWSSAEQQQQHHHQQQQQQLASRHHCQSPARSSSSGIGHSRCHRIGALSRFSCDLSGAAGEWQQSCAATHEKEDWEVVSPTTTTAASSSSSSGSNAHRFPGCYFENPLHSQLSAPLPAPAAERCFRQMQSSLHPRPGRSSSAMTHQATPQMARHLTHQMTHVPSRQVPRQALDRVLPAVAAACGGLPGPLGSGRSHWQQLREQQSHSGCAEEGGRRAAGEGSLAMAMQWAAAVDGSSSSCCGSAQSRAAGARVSERSSSVPLRESHRWLAKQMEEGREGGSLRCRRSRLGLTAGRSGVRNAAAEEALEKAAESLQGSQQGSSSPGWADAGPWAEVEGLADMGGRQEDSLSGNQWAAPSASAAAASLPWEVIELLPWDCRWGSGDLQEAPVGGLGESNSGLAEVSALCKEMLRRMQSS